MSIMPAGTPTSEQPRTPAAPRSNQCEIDGKAERGLAEWRTRPPLDREAHAERRESGPTFGAHLERFAGRPRRTQARRRFACAKTGFVALICFYLALATFCIEGDHN